MNHIEPYPIHSDNINKKLHKALVEACKTYRRSLEKERVYSYSHHTLYDLYMTYGQIPVDVELDKQFRAVTKRKSHKD